MTLWRFCISGPISSRGTWEYDGASSAGFFDFFLRMSHIPNMIRARTATAPMTIPAIAPAPREEPDGAGSGVGDGDGDGVGVGVGVGVDVVIPPRVSLVVSSTVVVKPRSLAQP